MILTADYCKLRLTKHNLQGLFVDNYPKHIKSRAPDLTIDMFGDETDPLKHLTVEDALTLISLGWKSEARIEELSRPVRVELVSVYHYGDPHHLDESWQETQASPHFYSCLFNGLTRHVLNGCESLYYCYYEIPAVFRERRR